MNINRLILGVGIAAALFNPAALAADDLEGLAGKWSVKKVNDEGQNYTQTIAVNKNKFIFEILAAEDRVVLHAEGDLKLEKAGPFDAVRFANIRAGESASDLRDVDEEYAAIYRLEGDTWTMAANFDRVREGQKPSLDLYRRVKTAAATGTLVIDEIQMADTPQSATWFFCFDAKVGGVSRRYHVEGKGYDKNQVTIPMALELANVQAGQKCSFRVQLDDVEEDVCTDEIDNRSTGEFTVSQKGSQDFKPEDNWRYTVRWHLK